MGFVTASRVNDPTRFVDWTALLDITRLAQEVFGQAQGRHLLGTDTLRRMHSVGTVSKSDSSGVLDQRRRPICMWIAALIWVPTIHDRHALRAKNPELQSLPNDVRFRMADELSRPLDVAPTARVREKAEVADPYEPIRQHMQQKTPHEL